MPTYEYACRNCQEHIEVVQSFTDDPLVECGLCGGSLRKVFSPAGIIFKGSGYYVTDTRASDQSRPAASDGAKKPAGDSSGDGAKDADGGSSGDGTKDADGGSSGDGTKGAGSGSSDGASDRGSGSGESGASARKSA